MSWIDLATKVYVIERIVGIVIGIPAIALFIYIRFFYEETKDE